jgi:hypothetical protein
MCLPSAMCSQGVEKPQNQYLIDVLAKLEAAAQQ